MQVAMRSYLVAGVSVVAAGALVAGPIAPAPEIRVPASQTHAIELAALPTWVTDLQAGLNTVLGNLSDIAAGEIADPAPILTQIAANQLHNGQVLGAAFVNSAQVLSTYAVNAPFQLVNAVDAGVTFGFDSPQFLGAAMALVGATIALPGAAAGPIDQAVGTVINNTVFHAGAAFTAMVNTVPAIVTEALQGRIAVLTTALQQGLALGLIAVTNPLGLPNALGNAAVAVGTSFVNEVSDVVEAAGTARAAVVAALALPNPTPPAAPTLARDTAALRPVVLDATPSIAAPVPTPVTALKRVVRVTSQVAESSVDVGETVVRAQGQITKAVVAGTESVANAALDGDDIGEAITTANAKVLKVTADGRANVQAAVTKAQTDIKNAINGDTESQAKGVAAATGTTTKATTTKATAKATTTKAEKRAAKKAARQAAEPATKAAAG
jgi:hypothetical protein